MPFFKTTFNILKKPDEDEAWNDNWMDSDTIITPPKTEWDYKRDMKIEDVQLWEVLYEGSGGIGLYAAWEPYAECYMITSGIDFKNAPRFFDSDPGIPYWDRIVDIYYGLGCQQSVIQKANELGIPLNFQQHWIENENMWLYQKPENKKLVTY